MSPIKFSFFLATDFLSLADRNAHIQSNTFYAAFAFWPLWLSFPFASRLHAVYCETEQNNVYFVFFVLSRLFFFSFFFATAAAAGADGFCQFYHLNLLTLSNKHDFSSTKMHNSDNGGSLPTFRCWQNLFLIEKQKNKNKTKEIVCVLYYDEDKTFLFVGPMCQRIQYTQYTNTIHKCDIKYKVTGHHFWILIANRELSD